MMSSFRFVPPGIGEINESNVEFTFLFRTTCRFSDKIKDYKSFREFSKERTQPINSRNVIRKKVKVLKKLKSLTGGDHGLDAQVL